MCIRLDTNECNLLESKKAFSGYLRRHFKVIFIQIRDYVLLNNDIQPTPGLESRVVQPPSSIKLHWGLFLFSHYVA